MKSERRHELEKNELADWLGGIIEAIKPYQNAILGAVFLVVVAAGSYAWWNRQTAAKTAEGWDAFYAAMAQLDAPPYDLEEVIADLNDVIRQCPNTRVAHWSGTVAGDLRLASGCSQLFANKVNANQELRDAVDYYLAVCEESPVMRERATFGLARARESLGNLDEARQSYEDVVRDWPDGAYAAEATNRLKDLGRPATKQFYDRFAKFDPQPESFIDEPGVPGERPAFDLDSLPEGPVFDGVSPLMDLKERGVEEDQPQDAVPPPSDAVEPESTEPDPAGSTPADPEAIQPEPAPVPLEPEAAGAEPAQAEPADTTPTAAAPADPAPAESGPEDSSQSVPNEGE